MRALIRLVLVVIINNWLKKWVLKWKLYIVYKHSFIPLPGLFIYITIMGMSSYLQVVTTLSSFYSVSSEDKNKMEKAETCASLQRAGSGRSAFLCVRGRWVSEPPTGPWGLAAGTHCVCACACVCVHSPIAVLIFVCSSKWESRSPNCITNPIRCAQTEDSGDYADQILNFCPGLIPKRTSTHKN